MEFIQYMANDFGGARDGPNLILPGYLITAICG